MTPVDVDVAVIGAGIAGLAAAYELKQRGLTVQLLESSGVRAGGVIVTDHGDGWTIDGGPDSLLVQKPAAVSLCRTLGIADRLFPTLVPRTAYVLRDERLHPITEGSFLGFPIRFGALVQSSLFSLPGKLRMACELVVPRGGGDRDESIGSFARRRFGEEAADYLAEPLLAGIHAGDVDRLSARTLFPRLVDAERTAGSVIRAFRALHIRASPQGAFVSLPGGIGELVSVLSAALPAGTLQLGAHVTELRRTAATYTIESDAGVVRAGAVILAVPAYVAAGLLRRFDTTLAGLCDAVPYASTATVALGFREGQLSTPLQGSGFVVPRTERVPLIAATFVTSKWPGRAPPGHVLLRGFVGGARDPRRLERTDEQLVQLVHDALGDILKIDGDPVLARVYRFTRQSPQYEVGHAQRLAAIDERLGAIPGLFLTGSGFRSIGIPDCIADGRDVAGRAARFVRARAA